MAERIIDVVTFTNPWDGLTTNVQIGDLSGLLDLGSEHGIAGGTDLSSESNPNIVASDSRLRIQFRGSAEGCLTFDEDAITGIHAPTLTTLDFTVEGTRILRLDADEGLSIWSVSGESVISIARHGNSSSFGADIHGSARLAISADYDVGVMIDTGNLYTDRRFSVRANGGTFDDSDEVFFASEDSKIGMRSASVYHQATGIVKFANSFFEVAPMEADGGVKIYGLLSDSSACNATNIYGLSTATTDTTVGTGGRGLIELWGGRLSSGSLADVTSSGNVFVIRARRGGAWETVYIVDEDGDVARDGGITTFDEEDDALAVSDLYRVLAGEEDKVIRYDRNRLESMGAIGSVGPSGKTMYREKVRDGLVFGAIRQLRERQDKMIAFMNERFGGSVEETAK